MPVSSKGGPNPNRDDNKLLTHIRSLPLPVYLASSPLDIAGNISEEHKIVNAKALAYFAGVYAGSRKGGNGRLGLGLGLGEQMCFGRAIGERLRLVRVDVKRRDVGRRVGEGEDPGENAGEMEAVGECEITIEEDMTNPYGGLHGACTAYLVDLCSSVPLVAIAIATDTDLFGLSQTMHLTWHAPAQRGTHLRIVGSSVAVNGRTLTGRCELWDKERDRLIASATHTTVRPWRDRARSKDKRVEAKL